MKLCTVTEFKELIKAYPNGGVVFTEYDQPQDLLLTLSLIHISEPTRQF